MAERLDYIVKREKLNIQKFNDYLLHRSNEFDIRYESIKSGERAGETIEVKIPKVPSMTSFCHYIGITKKTFYSWLDKLDDEDSGNLELINFITYVQEYLKEDRLSKGLNNLINAQLLARVDGYNDTIDINNTGTAPVLNIQLPINSKLQQIANDTNFIPINNKELNS